eukprot:12935758-Prorocentrum_lima.AAC.1
MRSVAFDGNVSVLPVTLESTYIAQQCSSDRWLSSGKSSPSGLGARIISKKKGQCVVSSPCNSTPTLEQCPSGRC